MPQDENCRDTVAKSNFPVSSCHGSGVVQAVIQPKWKRLDITLFQETNKKMRERPGNSAWKSCQGRLHVFQ